MPQRLAWLFGCMRKDGFYANLGNLADSLRIQSRLDDDRIDITRREFTDLVRMTVANWFEQLPRVSADQRERVRELFLGMRPYLNRRGQEQFDSIYTPRDN